jgi:hypothetical protein
MSKSKLYVKSRPFRTIQTVLALTLPFPVHPDTRLAQLSESAPTFGVLEPFRTDSTTELQGFRPNMISGTALELHQLAEQVELGTVDLSSVDHCVIVLTRCGYAPVSDVARVVLWQTFGVPVYEVFIGLDNSILGYECELHEGWHLAAKVGFRELGGELMLDAPGNSGLHTSLGGFVTDDKCPCGRSGQRLMNVQPAHRLKVAYRWAASA